MSDHKWDRFKRAFGGNPSDDLITVRDNKVKASLAEVDTQINRLTTAGLDATELQRQRDAVETSRSKALALKSNRDKSAALDTAKENARKLAADAPATVDKRIDTLNGELERLRGSIRSAIAEAKGLDHPTCKQAAAGAAQTVERAFQTAEGRPNDEAKRAALEDIDVQSLRDAMKVARHANAFYKSTVSTLLSTEQNLADLPDGDVKTGFTTELNRLTREKDALAQEQDLAQLRNKAEALRKEAGTLSDSVFDERTRYKKVMDKITALLGVINPLIASAKAVKFAAGQAVVDGALKTVEAATANARLQTPEQAQLDALEKIDTKPLMLAIASARDIDSGVTRLLEGLADGIGKLPNGKKKDGLANDLAKLATRAQDLDKEADLETARKGYAALRSPAEKLMDEVLKVRGKDGYTDALKARFGVDVEAKPGAKVNVQGAYEMLTLVPESHVGHDKLTKLVFTASSEGGGAYERGAIDMDDFGVLANKGYIYSVEGKIVWPNGFNVCMLHEIGHSVDDKYGIMAGLMGKAGYGDWKVESKDSVKAEITKAALAALKNPPGPLQAKVAKLIEDALGGAEVSKPDEANREQWKTLKKYTDIALAITVGKEPWFNAKPSSVEVGGRVYVQSYKDEWHSYALSEYKGSLVRDYQWRAPGEWFADLYGVLWMSKKTAPSGVGPALARWLPT